ncbi:MULTISPECIES: ACT domain-containing protein [Leuconostoc]|uniref:ACT domain-containing protein n=1 Tax=Leuconostoc TaxID=1243 RepID=UPI0011DD0559|nr:MULTISPECIES: ACT domain-containing protein [Leuconostoc]MBK0039931.1 ACT domain-containing protein [Leuconostoc sp. S51]MBK0050890.1 ACT domain-containing protein [Leuconostoc sp. S50]MBS0956951.1 ACT domain-containing protein [Leuconostoc pseudomesenteroides]MCT4381317.1 ACT domain-containing protein [Leuconostoc pseudomesenteroides]MCT4412498.1 ACT domain-containing protein [Leuconostoc pseudomesenteroides]
MSKAVITVVGQDKPGIIAAVASNLSKHHINILDVSQTIMQNIFTMSMLVNLETLDEQFNALQDELNQLGDELGVTIHTQREEIFETMSRVSTQDQSF